MRGLSVIVLSICVVTTSFAAGNPVASGLDSYLRMREEYRQDISHEQDLQLQRQQIELQRRQLELLEESDKRERERHEMDMKQRREKIEKARDESDQKIKTYIDRNIDEQYALFLKMYPEYSSNSVLSKALSDAFIKIQNESRFASKIMDMGTFTEILLEAHKIVSQQHKSK